MKISLSILFLISILHLTSSVCSFAVEPVIEWTNTYNNPGNKSDMGHGITVDKSGNVYVVGFEDRSDLKQFHNIWIRKYNASGLIQWTTTYNSAGNNPEIGYAIAADIEGNVYVAGFETVPEKGTDILVIKYNPDGLIQWTTMYNSPGNDVDSAQGITVDKSGNVYVTGFEDRADLKQGKNIWIRKYNKDGLTQWTETYHSARNNSEVGNDIAVGTEGNVYVVGYITVEHKVHRRRASFVRKYDTNGVLKWMDIYKDKKSKINTVGYGIAVDIEGNAYVTGYTTVMDEISYNAVWVIKYDRNGDVQWTEKFFSPSVNSEGKDIAVDKSGNVYINGYSGKDMWLRKYDTNGLVQWTTTYNNPSNSEDFGHGIEVDNNFNVYVTGYENRSDLAQSYNIFVRKYHQPFNPVLSWLGERNYTSRGINLRKGNTSTNFIYCVKYTDASNDAPKTDYPKVHIKKNGIGLAGSPFKMTYVSGNNNTGAAYKYSTIFSTGTNYTYYFEAYNVWNTSATGIATDEMDGPDVSAVPAYDTKDSKSKYGKFTCRIFTLAGEIVYEETKSSISEKRFEWIPTDIASGIYIASVEGSGIKIYKKVAVVKH
jgi:hypothetical protein